MAQTVCTLLFLTLLGAVQADEYEVPPAKREHWAWQRPVRPALPLVRDRGWARNPIDNFIQIRLEASSLRPAPQAGKEQLLRRVTFDLTGLPPTPTELTKFLADDDPAAWERVVERLLASPHYGERWGRHWLDLARYADSNGYEFDEVRPDAWRYRDYVIASLNADKPYDRFIHEQLAGDELWPDDPQALIATGFNLLGPDMTDASEQAQRRLNTLNDMTDTTALAFLGLTVACARCHNHKFEPIPQADYYRLQAFFAPASFRKDLPIAPPELRERHARALDAYRAVIKPTEDELKSLEAPYRQKLRAAKFAKISDEAQEAHQTQEGQRTARQRDLVLETNRLIEVSAAEVLKALSDADRTKHDRQTKVLKGFDKQRPAALPVAIGLQDDLKNPAKTYFLERGERTNRGPEVDAGFPIILVPNHKPQAAEVKAPRPQTAGRRTALARWITDPATSLTVRVMVNRVWQHHFGRGIVSTSSDFGIRGERPTHPELLDWLAVEFMDQGWELKQLQRLILTSATYQQAATSSAESQKLDPDNRLFSRMSRQRLEGEIIRDSLLAVSGRLNSKTGGPGVFPPLPSEVAPTKAWPVSADLRDHRRRSIYTFARRNQPHPFLQSFDLPDSSLSCPRREHSVTAPQALTLFNSREVTEACQALAEQLKTTTGDAERIDVAYRLTLGRAPSARERELAREFLKSSPLAELCRALINTNEFIFID